MIFYYFINQIKSLTNRDLFSENVIPDTVVIKIQKWTNGFPSACSFREQDEIWFLEPGKYRSI